MGERLGGTQGKARLSRPAEGRTRMGNGAPVLFGDGHVRWLRPVAYLSNTERIDAAGTPVGVKGAPVTPVNEATWRAFWDTSSP